MSVYVYKKSILGDELANNLSNENIVWDIQQQW